MTEADLDELRFWALHRVNREVIWPYTPWVMSGAQRVEADARAAAIVAAAERGWWGWGSLSARRRRLVALIESLGR